MDKVYNRFTLEQLYRIYDKLTHDYYWTFKKGEAVNYIVRDKNKTNANKEDIQKRVDEIKAKMPKNLYSKDK